MVNEGEFFRTIADHVPAMIAVYNIKTGKYLFVNKSIKKLLGYEQKDFLEKGLAFVSQLVHQDDVAQITKKNLKALDMANSPKYAKIINESIVDFEYRMRHKKGHYVWLLTDGSVFSRDKSGQVECVMNVSIDITNRKEAEAKLGKMTANILESISDAVITTGLDYKIVSWNRAAEELYGYKVDEVVGKSAREIVKTRYEGGPLPWIKELENTGKWKGEAIQQRKDGTEVFVLASVSEVKDENGKLVGYVAANKDITDRKKLEERKDDFVALASHELKTPLTSLKIFAQVLEQRFKKLKDEIAMKQLASMNRQIDKLTELITGLLDVSRAQMGKIDYRKDQFAIDELIYETIENIGRVYKSHDIIITGKSGVQVMADWDRISQVLTNLTTNAIKYSPEGKQVELKVEKHKGEVVVSVKDHGIGISVADQRKIFDRFFQADHPYSKTLPGLGLGLYISKEIIDRHGGKIWVESIPSKGSTFYFSLPAA